MDQTHTLSQLLRGASKPTLPPGDMDGGMLPPEMEEMLGMPGVMDAQPQMHRAMGVTDGGSPMLQALGLPGLMRLLRLGGGDQTDDFLRPRPNEPGVSGVDPRGSAASMGVLRQPEGLESMPWYTPGPLSQLPEPTPTGFTDEGASARQRARIGGDRPAAMAALLRGGR